MSHHLQPRATVAIFVGLPAMESVEPDPPDPIMKIIEELDIEGMIRKEVVKETDPLLKMIEELKRKNQDLEKEVQEMKQDIKTLAEARPSFTRITEIKNKFNTISDGPKTPLPNASFGMAGNSQTLPSSSLPLFPPAVLQTGATQRRPSISSTRPATREPTAR